MVRIKMNTDVWEVPIANMSGLSYSEKEVHKVARKGECGWLLEEGRVVMDHKCKKYEPGEAEENLLSFGPIPDWAYTEIYCTN